MPRRVSPFDGVLVRVVAEVQHQVEVVLEHVAIGRVVAAGPILARCKREAELVDHRVLGRGGAKVPDGTLVVPRIELVKVIAAGPEPLDLDINRVGERGKRGRRPAAHDAAHTDVRCDTPANPHGVVSHAAGVSRLGGEARPQDDAVRRGIARGDAERERIRTRAVGRK